MKRARITTLNELPIDFDIEKYRCTHQFTLADWVANLEIRVFCASLISNPGRDWVDRGRQFTAHIIEKPIYTKPILSDALPTQFNAMHVWDLTVADYFFGDRKFYGERMSRYYEAFDRCMDQRDQGSTPLAEDQELIDQPLWKSLQTVGIDDCGHVYLRVDLHGSEEKTVSDFRSWLCEIRKARRIEAPTKKISPADLSDWARYQVLPFLDLMHWASSHGKELSQQLLGVALFPGEYEVQLAERIRKVVKPLARRVANETFTDALRTQALSEMAERDSVSSIPDK